MHWGTRAETMDIVHADGWTRSAADVILDSRRTRQTGFRLPVNCVRRVSLSHQIAHFLTSANFARAIAAAEVRFSTLSFTKMRWTCLQIVPVQALRITPIS